MSLRLPVLIALALAAGSVSLAYAQAQPAKPDTPGCCAAKPAPAPADSAGCCGMKTAQPRGGGMGMGRMGGMGGMEMPMPTAADQARLDSLVTLMHQSKGDKKVAAMEKVLDELLAHRAAMMEHMMHMRHMMQGMDSGAPVPEHQHQMQ